MSIPGILLRLFPGTFMIVQTSGKTAAVDMGIVS
jgi:hypothetical protein